LLLALDPKTGTEIWKSDKHFGHGHWPQVAFRDGRLFVGGSAGPFRCFDAKTGNLVWESEGKSYFAGAISPKGVAMRTYGSPAKVYDLATGRPTLGKDGKQVCFGRGSSTGCSPLIIVNGEWGIQHSGGESRHMSVGRIDRTETAWEFQLAGRACAGSAVAHGCIYTPSNGDGLLFCFEHDDGKPPVAPAYAPYAGAVPPMPQIGRNDWPQFKFDGARSGCAPTQVLKTPLSLKWQIKLDAPCLTSPAVMDGKVFVVDADGTAYGIDAAAQKVLWKRPTGGVNNRSSPVAVGGKVYFGSADRNFYMLDATNGKIVKKVPMPHTVIAAPALSDEGRLYVQSFDGTLLALDLDANVLWALKLQPSSWWLASQTIAPAPHDVAARGRKVLTVAGNSLFLVHDEGKAGKVDWAHHGTWASGASFLGDTFLIGNAPAEQENQLLQCLLDDKITKRSSGPNGDRRNEYVKAAWEIGRVNTAPSASSTRACFGSVRGGFWCVDLAATPRDKRSPPPNAWTTGGVARDGKGFGATGFVGGAALAKEHCVFGGLDGSLYVIRLDAKGEGLSKIQPGPYVFESPDSAMILSTPAISNGNIYFTTASGTLYCLASGEE
jgi:outer membrane protein assembly factor BamB